MASNYMLKSLTFSLILLIISFNFIDSEARPLGTTKSHKSAATRAIEGFFDGLTLGAIKESGPSPGVGHKFVDGGIKAGPSPGVGHKFVDGGIKAGPSPGEGHNQVTATHQ